MYETCQNDGFAFEENKVQRPIFDSQQRKDDNLEKKKDELNKNILFANQERNFDEVFKEEVGQLSTYHFTDKAGMNNKQLELEDKAK